MKITSAQSVNSWFFLTVSILLLLNKDQFNFFSIFILFVSWFAYWMPPITLPSLSPKMRFFNSYKLLNVGVCLYYSFGPFFFPRVFGPLHPMYYSYLLQGLFGILMVLLINDRLSLRKYTPGIILLMLFYIWATVFHYTTSPYLEEYRINFSSYHAFFQGINPYTNKIPSFLPEALMQSKFPLGLHFQYLPGPLLMLMPGAFFDLDFRLILASYLLLASFLIWRRNNNYHQAMFLLINPISLEVLRRGHFVVLVFFLIMVVCFINSKNSRNGNGKSWPFYLGMNFLFCTHFLVWPLALYLLWLKKRQRFFSALLLSLPLFLLSACYYITCDWRSFVAFTTGLHHFALPHIEGLYPGNHRTALSFVQWFKLKLNHKIDFLHFPLFLGFVTSTIVSLRQKNLRAARAWIFLAYWGWFSFASNSTMEHYWILLATYLIFRPQLTWKALTVENFFFYASRGWLLFSLAYFASDVEYYYRLTNKIFDGLIPYQDFPFEYPPLALLTFLLPGMLSQWVLENHYLQFRFFFMLQMLVIEISFYHWLKKYLPSRFSSWVYLIGGALMFQTLYDRLDLLMGIILVVATICYQQGKLIKSNLLAFLGAAFKVIPGLLIPFSVIHYPQWNRKKIIHYFTIGIFAGLVMVASCYLIFGAKILDFFRYHKDRGIQIESSYAAINYWWAHYVDRPIKSLVYHSHGSFNLWDQFDFFATFSTLASLGLIGWLLWITWRQQRPIFFIDLVFCLLIGLFCTAKVLSPQYFIWPLLLFPFTSFNNLRSGENILVIALFLLTIIATATLFYYYNLFLSGNRYLWQLLLLRSLMIVVIFIISYQRLFIRPELAVDTSTTNLDRPPT